MNRRIVLIVIAIVAVLGITAFAQQRRPYNLVMKDVGATFASLRKNLEANNGPAAADDAVKLQALFTETEAFWAAFNTHDAMGFTKRAREAAAAISTAGRANDVKAAQASSAVIQKTCANCHLTHREETAKGFLIKP
jgi:hypothetical protein